MTKTSPAQILRDSARRANAIYSVKPESYSEETPESWALANINLLGSADELFLVTDQLVSGEKEKGEAEYRCAVTVNHLTKEITFITSGTRMGEDANRALADIRDDARMAFGANPRKLEAAKAMNQTILDQLGDGAKDYTFHYTGHSLGAALSDVAATDMAIKLHKKGQLQKDMVSTATFENPGAHTLVANLLKESGMKLDDDWRDKVNYKAFNNRPNFINTMDKQVGEKYELVPDKQGERNILQQFVSWVASKCPGKFISKILQFVSFGRISTQAKEHSSSHPINVIAEGNGRLIFKGENGKSMISVEDAMRGIEPIKYDAKLLAALETVLKDPKSKLTDKPKYSMTSEHGDVRLEFSKAELEAARLMTKSKSFVQAEKVRAEERSAGSSVAR